MAAAIAYKRPAMMALLTTLYAQDLQRLARFYEQMLALTRLEAEAGFVLLGDAAGSVQLAIVQVPADLAERIVLTVPPAAREDTPIKLSFAVAAIEPLRPVVAAAGGRLRPVESAWAWRGARHLDGLDPEGNVFQLREPA